MKYYLTYYEAYPIYEPAEGGYYYEGRTAIKWWESENLKELVDFIPNFVKDYEVWDMELTNYGTLKDIKKELKDWGYVIVALTHAKYIGDDMYLLLENEKAFQKYEAHWHPYE